MDEKNFLTDIPVFQNNLLEWYHKKKRSLPWRENPTPYHVWISEIMLQQTRVEAVKEYYARFIEVLPDIASLASVDDEVLDKLWEGLGYYSRARNLKKSARTVMEDYDGELPNTCHELLKLRGIGPYTAGAIASIAFHEAVPAVDGNVMRVISRIFGYYGDITEPSVKKEMEHLVSELLVKKEVHHFNQALMELGALVCLPNGEPNCNSCPVKELCFAFLNAKQSELPVKKKKKARKIEERTIFVLADEYNRFYIQKRAPKGLLSNLWEFPSAPSHLSIKDCVSFLQQYGFEVLKLTEIEQAKHIFSHIEWHMKGYFAKINSNFIKETQLNYNETSYVWSSKEEIEEIYCLPSAFKTYLNSIDKGDIFHELNRFVHNKIQP